MRVRAQYDNNSITCTKPSATAQVLHASALMSSAADSAVDHTPLHPLSAVSIFDTSSSTASVLGIPDT